MQVGMMKQVRAPGMEYGEKADLSTQVFGISGDGASAENAASTKSRSGSRALHPDYGML